jgi:hypothetical protein
MTCDYSTQEYIRRHDKSVLDARMLDDHERWASALTHLCVSVVITVRDAVVVITLLIIIDAEVPGV